MKPNSVKAGVSFKTRIIGLLVAVLVAFALGGCYMTPRETYTLAGTGIGAGGGALVGSAVGAPGTGAIIGGLGGALGGYLIGNSVQHQYYRNPYGYYPYY
jgi:hypothetical protein